MDDLDSLVKQIVFCENSKLILIGGLSRAGKTSFANELKNLLQTINISSIVIGLDGWLVPKKDRKYKYKILDKYKTNDICSFFQMLLSITEPSYITYPIFNEIDRENLLNNCLISPQDILIVEGIPALMISCLIVNSTIRIFLDISEQTRLRRIYSLYSERGMNLVDINNLIKSRDIEVLDVKNTSKINANIFLIDNIK